MSEYTNKKHTSVRQNKSQYSITNILTVIVILATLIASIPSFIALDKDTPKIFYEVKTSSISIPEALDIVKVQRILQENGISVSNLGLSLINQGNSVAKEIKISVEVPGKIVRIWSNPNIEDKPVWVDIPDMSSFNNLKKVQFTIRNMSTTRILTFNIGYNEGLEDILLRQREQLNRMMAEAGLREDFELPRKIDIFFDGKQAEQVDDITSVPKWSKYQLFKLPLSLFIYGLSILFIGTFSVAIIKNANFLNMVKDVVIKTLKDFF